MLERGCSGVLPSLAPGITPVASLVPQRGRCDWEVVLLVLFPAGASG